jgi:dipeptidase
MAKTPVVVAAVTLFSAAINPAPARACTSIMVARGASADGSVMVTYSADSHELYGELYFYPAAVHPEGAMRDVHDWDHGDYLGKIKEARKTFQVVGNMNERQVVIAETTFGGRKELEDSKQGIDYGTLIYVALQRAATAREAISNITDLANEYGYRSKGESLSIGDPKEAWLLEMIGKGPGEKGIVWVAARVPDGHIAAHANYPRIRTFPRNDPANWMYAKDVVSFARKKGYFSGDDSAFSFADAYQPLTFKTLRSCEARVWSVYRRAAPSRNLSADYAKGVLDAEPLPLFLKPDRPLSVQDVMSLMRDHFTGTDLDLSKGVGAGPFSLPYRWRPMHWKVDGVEYVHERAISTQQTGFSFVSQSRAWLPDPVAGILWFGVDDTSSTVYMPVYAGIRRVPKPLAVGTGDFHRFSWDSMFWVFNAVANFAYSRYKDIIGDVRAVQAELEGAFLARQADVEKAAVDLHKRAPELARDYLTSYTEEQALKVHGRWRRLFEQILVKYLDGNVRDEKGKVTHPEYPEFWYRRIVEDEGERVRVRRLKDEPETPPKPPEQGACAPCEQRRQ